MDLNRITNPYASPGREAEPLPAPELSSKVPRPVFRWRVIPTLFLGLHAIGQSLSGCAGLIMSVAAIWMKRQVRTDVWSHLLPASMLWLLGGACAWIATWAWWKGRWWLACVLSAVAAIFGWWATTTMIALR